MDHLITETDLKFLAAAAVVEPSQADYVIADGTAPSPTWTPDLGTLKSQSKDLRSC